MPICSGVEVARRLRQLDRKDFVVGVTGNALTEDQQEYLQAGANQLRHSTPFWYQGRY
jgi:CheY-like chemotaxis protein